MSLIPTSLLESFDPQIRWLESDPEITDQENFSILSSPFVCRLRGEPKLPLGGSAGAELSVCIKAKPRLIQTSLTKISQKNSNFLRVAIGQSRKIMIFIGELGGWVHADY